MNEAPWLWRMRLKNQRNEKKPAAETAGGGRGAGGVEALDNPTRPDAAEQAVERVRRYVHPTDAEANVFILCDTQVDRDGTPYPVYRRQTGPQEKAEVLSAAELCERYPTIRRPLVHGLLREGEVMNVIAPAKTGKSWLALSLAVSVAAGRRWLDSFLCECGPVLLLDNELHHETLADRIPRVVEALGVDMADVAGSLRAVSLRGRLCPLPLVGNYLEHEPKMVILDAVYRFLGHAVSENDNSAMAGLYNIIDALAQQHGCSFVLIHHSSKGSQAYKEITDVGSGAGAQSRAADTHLILRPHEQPNAVVLQAVMRSWPPVEPKVLRWNYPIWTPDYDLDPTDLRDLRKKPTEEAAKWKVLEFVRRFLDEKPLAKQTIRRRATDPKVSPKLTWRMSEDLLLEAVDMGLAYLWLVPTGKTHRHAYATVRQPEAGRNAEAPALERKASKGGL